MTAGMSHRRAVEIIQAGGNMIRLGVRRLLPPLLPSQTTSSSDVKCQLPPPPPMSYAPFPPPIPALNPSPVPTGPPNLRLPQLFTPMPVHRTPSSSQRPLLSSAKNLSREQAIVNYQSLPRLLQKKTPSSRRDLDAWVGGKSGFTDPGKYRPCNIQL